VRGAPRINALGVLADEQREAGEKKKKQLKLWKKKGNDLATEPIFSQGREGRKDKKFINQALCQKGGRREGSRQSYFGIEAHRTRGEKDSSLAGKEGGWTIFSRKEF